MAKLFDHWTIDFESRSEVPIKLGAARYAEDPSTEVLMMCYSDNVPGDHVSDWLSPVLEPYGIDPSKPPTDLFEWVAQGGLVEGHNSFFERMIWRHKMVPLYGWPDIPDNQWRCSAAKAAAASLPRGLGKAAQIMRCDTQKDEGGHQLMLRLCKPRAVWTQWKSGKRKGAEPEKYFGSKEEFLRELEYCRDDVRTEKALSFRLPDLTPFEWRVWQVDQAMNELGIPLDLEMARHILDMIERYKVRQRQLLMAMTDGTVERETKRNDLKAWFDLQDYPIENTQADTLRDIAEEYPYDVIGQVAALVRELNKSSTAKYKAMIDRANEDGRARDNLMYHGAGTGRWSGRGIQFQNLVSGSIKDMEAAVDAILEQNLSLVVAEHDDPMTLFASLVRGAVCAEEGKVLEVADYSSIEARGVMWASGESKGMEIFARGEDIYCDMAGQIYGHPVIANPAKQPKERKLGKQAILGLGYQMGPPKFLATCEKYRIFFTDDMVNAIVPGERQEQIEDEIREQPIFYFPKGRVVEDKMKSLILAKHIVTTYRDYYSKIPELWRNCEDAAILAVEDFEEGRPRVWRRAGPKLEYGNVFYKVVGKFLFCKLPSGRHIAYPFPRLGWTKTLWGSEKLTLIYKGVDSFTKQWTDQYGYGGKFVENIVQGFCRDITAEAMVRLHDHPHYTPILSVHDEIVSERFLDEGFTDEVEWLMEQRPTWAPDFPIEVEGWSGKRYRK